MRRALGIFLTGLCLIITETYGQGCSDAGFCTMGAMRPDQAYSKKINPKLRSMELNLYRGTTLTSPIIYVATVDATIGLNDRNFIQIKLPYQYADGNLGAIGGMGDISLSYTSVLKATQAYTLSGTLGGKIPMGDGNKTIQNQHTTDNEARPLHMYYQPSLGSYDIVGGISWINDKWLFATGIQIPLTRNDNQFVWTRDFQNYPNQNYLRHYNHGPELMRGTDVMFRVERNWRFTNYNFSVGLLPIWRVTKDNTLVPDLSIPREQWIRADIDGTTGMALSGLFSFGYNFDVNSSIKYIFGLKLTDRDFNPDGLTRHDVNSFSYIYKF